MCLSSLGQFFTSVNNNKKSIVSFFIFSLHFPEISRGYFPPTTGQSAPVPLDRSWVKALAKPKKI